MRDVPPVPKRFSPLRARPLLAGLAAVGLSLFAPHSAWAAAKITISETTRMAWGTVAVPPSGSQYLDIPPGGGAPTGTGTVLFGTPSRGVYSLKRSGGGSTSINIDITNISSGSAYLTIGNFTGIYSSTNINSFPSGTLPLPSTSGTPLYLGARETVTSSMPAGTSLTPGFTINVIVN